MDYDKVFCRFDGTSISQIKQIMADPKTRGVYKRKRADGSIAWYALIGVQGRTIRLGTFPTYAEAAAARRKAEEDYYLPLIREYEEKHGPV